MDRSISDPKPIPTDKLRSAWCELTDQPVGRGHGGGEATRTELLHDEKRSHPRVAQSPDMQSYPAGRRFLQDKRPDPARIADDEFCRRPFRPPCVGIGFLAIDNFRDRLAIPRQHSIPDLNILEGGGHCLYRGAFPAHWNLAD